MKYPIDMHMYHFEILEESSEKEFCACEQGKCTGNPGTGMTCAASFDIAEAIKTAAANKAKTAEEKFLIKIFGPKKGTQPEQEN